jgi:hypothetical protein
MNIELFISSIIGFTPAVAILWFTMRQYSWPIVDKSYFDDRKVFGMFAVGIVIGMLIFSFDIFLRGYWVGAGRFIIVPFLLIYVVGLSTFEELIRLIILNMPRFQLKFDTTFYGVSLGLGMGSIGITAMSFMRFPVGGIINITATLLVLLVFSTSVCLLHASLGGFIGFGCYKGRGWHYLVFAILIHLIFNLLMFPFLSLGNIEYSLITLPLSVVLYHYFRSKLLPQTLPEALRKERRRDIRKKMRG